MSISRNRDLLCLFGFQSHILGGTEESFVASAFKSNFIAPVGPQLNEFEAALEDYIGNGVHCVCIEWYSGTSSGVAYGKPRYWR